MKLYQHKVSELLNIFPLYPVPDIEKSMAGHGLEEYDDLFPLQGRNWVEVSGDDAYMMAHYTFPCWFVPAANLYYLPAVIAYTYKYAEQEISIPEVSTHMLSVITDKKLGIDFSTLTEPQRTVINQWVQYIKEVEERELELCKSEK